MRKQLLTLTLAALVLALSAITAGLSYAQNDDETTRPWLGVQIQDAEGGVAVMMVMPDSPAQAAGLQAGDLISAVNGSEFSTAEALIAQISELQVGDEVTLSVLRGEEALEISATLGEAPADVFSPAMPAMPMDGMGMMPFGEGRVFMMGPVLGVQYHTIDSTFAQNAGLSAEAGALVLYVLPESSASDAGLQAGDLITAVDGIALDDERTLDDLIADYEVGDSLTLTVQRAGEEQSLSVTLEESPIPMIQGMPFGQGGMPGRHGGRMEFFGEGMPGGHMEFFGNAMPFGEGMPGGPFRFEFRGGEEGMPFNFDFGQGQAMPFMFEFGDLLREFGDQFPADGSPFSIVCTDDEGNTVFSFSVVGAMNGEPPIQLETPNAEGGLDFENLNCEVQAGEVMPEGEGL